MQDHVARYAIIALINHLIITRAVNYRDLKQHFDKEAENFERTFTDAYADDPEGHARMAPEIAQIVAGLRDFIPEVQDGPNQRVALRLVKSDESSDDGI